VLGFFAAYAMVVASSGAAAADAGLALLKRGGTAMDAAMSAVGRRSGGLLSMTLACRSGRLVT
jgi:hypothetical protein